uniref:Uncharacterized protein n=1 Tax=Arundo donax TaxID=35708 RepID=A0A0A9EIR4_ARUDO
MCNCAWIFINGYVLYVCLFHSLCYLLLILPFMFCKNWVRDRDFAGMGHNREVPLAEGLLKSKSNDADLRTRKAKLIAKVIGDQSETVWTPYSEFS